MKMMKRLFAVISALAFVFFASACTAEATAVVYSMDTVSQIKIYADGRDEAKSLANSAEALIYRLDHVFSRESGDIAKLNSGQVSSLSGEAAETVLKALYIKELSGGAFTPEIGALTRIWNVSGRVGTVAEPPEKCDIEKALSFTGGAKVESSVLTLDGEIELDLGGIAKGAACEYIVREMISSGASGGIIDLGGNIGVFGRKPDGSGVYKVALTCAGEAFAYIDVTDAFVSVASSEIRFFTDAEGNTYHHILDPETGYPAESEFYAVAVICRDGAYADALSTAIFAAGWDKALAMRENCTTGFDVLALTKTGEVRTTKEYKIISGAETAVPDKYR